VAGRGTSRPCPILVSLLGACGNLQDLVSLAVTKPLILLSSPPAQVPVCSWTEVHSWRRVLQREVNCGHRENENKLGSTAERGVAWRWQGTFSALGVCSEGCRCTWPRYIALQHLLPSPRAARLTGNRCWAAAQASSSMGWRAFCHTYQWKDWPP
jgi:hypothetical protein